MFCHSNGRVSACLREVTSMHTLFHVKDQTHFERKRKRKVLREIGRMTSKRPFSEEDFTCPVCRDIFKDPVLLRCGHSVCRNCIQQYWTTKPSRECPLCRKKSVKNLTANLALKNLCQTFQDYRGPAEELCELHRERLCLFCLCDEQLVCVVCRESREHRTHTCRPANELAEERKVT